VIDARDVGTLGGGGLVLGGVLLETGGDLTFLLLVSGGGSDVEVSFKIGLYGFQCHDASLRKLSGKASVRDGSTFAAPQELQVSSQIERE